MTLIEALKSGKRFKLPAWDRWFIGDPSEENIYTLTRAQILSELWEVEEESIEITKSELFTAMRSFYSFGASAFGDSLVLWDKLKENK